MAAVRAQRFIWKLLYNILESSELDAMVFNVHYMKVISGHKTDVKDAEWIADILRYGLPRSSNIPDKDQPDIRELVRYRKIIVGELTSRLNNN